MAYYTQTRTNSLVERALVGTAQAFDKAAAAYAKYRVYTTTLNELRTLSSRDLSDLGLSRAMLKSIARDAAEGKTPR